MKGLATYPPPRSAGSPTHLERETTSQVPDKRLDCLRNPCGCVCGGGGGGAPELGTNKQWPIYGHTGYVTPSIPGFLKLQSGGKNQK